MTWAFSALAATASTPCFAEDKTPLAVDLSKNARRTIDLSSGTVSE